MPGDEVKRHLDLYFRLLRHDVVAPIADAVQHFRARGGISSLNTVSGNEWLGHRNFCCMAYLCWHSNISMIILLMWTDKRVTGQHLYCSVTLSILSELVHPTLERVARLCTPLYLMVSDASGLKE